MQLLESLGYSEPPSRQHITTSDSVVPTQRGMTTGDNVCISSPTSDTSGCKTLSDECQSYKERWWQFLSQGNGSISVTNISWGFETNVLSVLELRCMAYSGFAAPFPDRIRQTQLQGEGTTSTTYRRQFRLWRQGLDDRWRRGGRPFDSTDSTLEWI